MYSLSGTLSGPSPPMYTESPPTLTDISIYSTLYSHCTTVLLYIVTNYASSIDTHAVHPQAQQCHHADSRVYQQVLTHWEGLYKTSGGMCNVGSVGGSSLWVISDWQTQCCNTHMQSVSNNSTTHYHIVLRTMYMYVNLYVCVQRMKTSGGMWSVGSLEAAVCG